MPFGLTAEGLAVPTITDLRDALAQSVRDTFGASIDTGDRSVIGQLIGIIAERLASLWEGVEAVHSSQDPDKATGAALAALCALTGTFKDPATYSAVTLTLTGTPATVVPAESRASTASTQIEFETRISAEIVEADAWGGATAYAVGDRVRNADRIYDCTTAGTSAGSGGPTTTDTEIVDGVGSLRWQYVGEGTGYVDVVANAVETGPKTAVARDITVKESAVSGWSSVINLEDATVGADEATDAQLRIQRSNELATAGSGPVNALLAEILNVADVTSVRIFVNNTDTTDGDGVPPHSIEALVRGGDDQDIFDALLAGVVAGIRTHGTETGSSTDNQGTDHVIEFSRPSEIDVYVRLELVVDPDEYPADGDDQVELAVVSYGEAQETGKDAVPSRVAAATFDVDGVLEATAWLHTATIATPTTWTALTAYVGGNVVRNVDRLYICTVNGTSAASGGPTTTGSAITDGTVTWKYLGATIAIAPRELAAFDTSRITISTTEGTP